MPPRHSPPSRTLLRHSLLRASLPRHTLPPLVKFPAAAVLSLATTAATITALATTAAPTAAQELPFDLEVPVPGVVEYSADIPTPEEAIGHRIGTRHTRPHQLVEYLDIVGTASDRVTVRRHGETYEGRPLVHAIVTSPENHERLEQIRAANLELSDAPGSVSDARLAGMPVIVYLGYSVHGDEASGSEASLLTLYHLAAGRGSGVDDVLENAVVIIDPSLNPDGRDRFVDWVNGNRGRVATSDSEDREHRQPWPGGRTNHYLFDLNRDWLPAQHPSSRGRLELFHSWRPQLHTDHHEMGGDATFFFQPGVPSRNNPNTPARTVELTGAVGEYHARALDRIGALYYSEESYDDFYYGKGSTYPDVNGAVGILFEQASSRALLAETVHGELSYPFTVRNQVVTSLSTLEAAVDMRETLLRHQRDFYAEADDVADAGSVQAYVFGLEGSRTRGQKLARMLLRHRIQVHDLARSVSLDGRTFQPGEAFVVPVRQPQARLVNAMMERVTSFEDSIFYDVSAWTMPLAFGVPHGEVSGDPGGLLGPVVDDVELDGGRVVGAGAGAVSAAGAAGAAGASSFPYAYVMEWDRYYAPRALYRLQEAGLRPLLLTAPFEAVAAGGERRAFSRGAIVVPATARDAAVAPSAPANASIGDPPGAPTGAELDDLMRDIARMDHVVFHALGTGLTPEGVELGSAGARVLEKPSVAVLSGSGTSAYEVGEAWHLLNERMGIPVSLLDVDRVQSADLDRYTTVILAGFRGGLSNGGEDALKSWVRDGGTLIAMGSSVTWPIRQGLIDASFKGPDNAGGATDDTAEAGQGSESESAASEAAGDPGRVPYADVAARQGSEALGGAIFEAAVDTTHPLAYGYEERVALFRDNSTFLEPSGQPGTNVALYTDAPLLSGYISDAKLAMLSGSAAVIARGAGRGSVVLMPDNPDFRAFWYGTNGLLLNAVFFGGAF